MSKTFGLKFQSRVLRSFGHSAINSWIVATNSLREDNEVRVVDFDEKSETLISSLVYVHPNEVWDLALLPASSLSFLTSHGSGSNFAVTLWQTEENNEQLKRVCDIGEIGKKVERILSFEEGTEEGHILTLEETKIKAWDVREGGPEEVSCGMGEDLDQFSNMHISNTDPHVLYVTNGQGYQVWDMREMKMRSSLRYCHDMPMRTIDTAHHSVATCGDDCSVKIWDNRNPDKAVMELAGHSHWVWDATFNQKFPSLLLTASSDASVILWETAEIKEGTQASDLHPQGTGETSGTVKSFMYDDHDESVYCVSWSSRDDWIFASLSYDGRLAVNKVPSDIKYRILI